MKQAKKRRERQPQTRVRGLHEKEPVATTKVRTLVLNLPKPCPKTESMEVPPMTRIQEIRPEPRQTPSEQSGVDEQQHCDHGLPHQPDDDREESF